MLYPVTTGEPRGASSFLVGVSYGLDPPMAGGRASLRRAGSFRLGARLMRAGDIQLPRPGMLAGVPADPAKYRKMCRSTAKRIEENGVVRDWLISRGLADQVAWVLYPPRSLV